MALATSGIVFVVQADKGIEDFFKKVLPKVTNRDTETVAGLTQSTLGKELRKWEGRFIQRHPSHLHRLERSCQYLTKSRKVNYIVPE